jgi:hypothetical protein
MMCRYRLPVAVFWAWVFWACTVVPSWAEGPTPRQQLEAAIPGYSPKDMVMLPYGPNWIDLDGDGHRDLVMKSRYEMAENRPSSAAGYTFYMYAHLTDKALAEGRWVDQTHYPLLESFSDWYPILFQGQKTEDGDNRESEIVSSQYLFAGCISKDIRLVTHRSRERRGAVASYVVIAKRDAGDSVRDVMPVTFTVFKLTKEDPDATTEFTFLKIAEFRSAGRYCSVVDAFQKELGLKEHDEKGDSDVNGWKNR